VSPNDPLILLLLVTAQHQHWHRAGGRAGRYLPGV